MEGLLSYIEFKQYQTFAINALNITITGQDKKSQRIFPENVPKSSIVYGDYNLNDNILKCKYICYQLYLKYIKIGAKYEININSQTRYSLINLIDNKQKWIDNINIDEYELFKIFSKCSKEMIYLLTDSLSRAKVKPNVYEPLSNEDA